MVIRVAPGSAFSFSFISSEELLFVSLSLRIQFNSPP
jgi:hypothetical protein